MHHRAHSMPAFAGNYITKGGSIMRISRRDLRVCLPMLGMFAIGILPAGATEMSADEAAVAKRLEAFRAAQFSHDAKALGELCAEQLSYSHSDAHVEDRATFIKNAT